LRLIPPKSCSFHAQPKSASAKSLTLTKPKVCFRCPYSPYLSSLILYSLDVRTFDIDSTTSASVAFHPIGLVTGVLQGPQPLFLLPLGPSQRINSRASFRLDDGKLILWDVRNKSIVNTFTPTMTSKLSSTKAPLTATRITSFSPDGNYVLVSQGDAILVRILFFK